MSLSTGESRRPWRDGARALAERFAPVAAEVDRSGRFPAEHVTAVREAGLLGLCVPAELGGLGQGLPEAVEVLRTLAHGDGGTALGVAMHLMVTGSAARRAAGWPCALWERTARGAARGEVVVNNVASEAVLGSPARGGLPGTRAVARSSGGAAGGDRARVEEAGGEEEEQCWTLTGRKDWATWVPALTHAVVSGRLDTADGPRIAQLLVALDAPGVRRDAGVPGVGLRSAANGAVVLDGVRVAGDGLLHVRRPEEPDPRGSVMSAWFQLCTTAVYVGIAEAARDAVAGFARARRPNDRSEPIAAIPAVQARLGRMDADARVAVLLLDAAARLADDADARGAAAVDAVMPAVSSAKVRATELAWSVCEQALRLAGGAALQATADLPLERLARDVRGGLIHPPTEGSLHLTLGARLAEG